MTAARHYAHLLDSSIRQSAVTQHSAAMQALIAALARSQIAAGTANRLVYNASGTGLLADLSAITASRILRSNADGLPISIDAITPAKALISDANGYPTHSTVTSTELALLSGITSIANGCKLLTSYSASAQASVDIVSVLSLTYRMYYVTIVAIPATDDVELWLRTDDANGASFDAGASDYAWEILNNTLAAGGTEADAADSEIHLAGSNGAGGSVGNAGGESVSGFFLFDTIEQRMIGDFSYTNGGGGVVRCASGGKRIGGSTINALQILFESGNITAAQVRVYGLQNS